MAEGFCRYLYLQKLRYEVIKKVPIGYRSNYIDFQNFPRLLAQGSKFVVFKDKSIGAQRPLI